MYLQSHIYKNIPVSFDYITTWNQGVFLCSPCISFLETAQQQLFPSIRSVICHLYLFSSAISLFLLASLPCAFFPVFYSFRLFLAIVRWVVTVSYNFIVFLSFSDVLFFTSVTSFLPFFLSSAPCVSYTAFVRQINFPAFHLYNPPSLS